MWPKPDQIEMVKRNAGISIDEWLDIEVTSSHTTLAHIVATTEVGTSNYRSTAKGLHLEGRDQRVTGGPTDIVVERAQPVTVGATIVAESEGDSAKWFWRILELSGYEQW